MEPPKRADYLPVLCLDALIEDYLRGRAYLRLQMRSHELKQPHSATAQRHGLVSERAERGDLSVANTETEIWLGKRFERDFSMLVPVVHFVEHPQRMLSVRGVPSRIWGQVRDFSTRLPAKEADTRVVKLDGLVEDRELRCFLIVRRLHGEVLSGYGEDDVVEAIPQAVKRITDDEGEILRKWLHHLCVEHKAPVAIGLMNDSIAVEVPPGDERLSIANVSLRPGKLAPVTGLR